MNSEKRPSTLYNHSFLPVLAATYLTREMGVALRGLQATGPGNMKREGGSISDIGCFNIAGLIASSGSPCQQTQNHSRKITHESYKNSIISLCFHSFRTTCKRSMLRHTIIFTSFSLF